MSSHSPTPPRGGNGRQTSHSTLLQASLAMLALTLPALPVLATENANPCNCSCPEPGAETAGPAPVPRGKLRPADWSDLKGLDEAAATPAAWQAMLTGCGVLRADPVWSDLCQDAQALPEMPDAAGRLAFMRVHLQPWQAVAGDGQTEGLATGYYEPVLHGSRTPGSTYRYPLYTRPDDLLTVDLASVVPELRGRRVRARLDGNRVVPYYSRGEIDQSPPAALQGRELVWIDDPVEVFFLQIQGSGRVELAEGGGMHVGYADQNGQPFRSVARALIERGELSVAQASLQGIKAWARAHPDKVAQMLQLDPSYVFFREVAGDLPGPLGSLGVPLVAEGAVAVDARIVPLGAPVFVDTTLPMTQQPLRRIAMAQDTGGAINGAVRVDFYWGQGDDALAQAGRMRQKLRLWVLLPPGTHADGGAVLPDAPTAPAPLAGQPLPAAPGQP
ncbi:MAG: murein transglycosylase A [Pseudomonadota bacterium]|nr:murein transglycosylase A [Pseudomonadota bacterium]